jgi:ABC-type spermidine/putrescine transport system permease subunit II
MNRLRTSNFFFSLLISSVYIFLYLPIFVLVVFSFNSVAFPYRWVSFSWQWYQELFQSSEIWHALQNSLIVASAAVFFSLILGLLWVFYTIRSRMRSFESLFYINLLIPEIIFALGLLTLFIFFSIPLGLITLIAGHTVLGLGFCVPLLSAQFDQLDYNIIEASYDLGATMNQTFFRVVIPALWPALIASGLLVFIISLDDFLVSFFCAGPAAQTLSLYIFAMIRSGVSPTINALSTLLLLASSLIVLGFSLLKIQTRIF